MQMQKTKIKQIKKFKGSTSEKNYTVIKNPSKRVPNKNIGGVLALGLNYEITPHNYQILK